MAVYQLAGPVKITGIPSPDYGLAIWYQYYYPRRGILLMSGFQTTLVSFDGKCTGRLTQIYPRGWWPQQQKMLLYNGTEYVVEPHVFAVQTSGTDANPPGLPFIFANGTYVRLKDRRIWCSSGIHATWPDGSNVPEGPAVLFGGPPAQIQEGRSQTEVFIAGYIPSTGSVAGVFYDTETRKLSSPYYYVPTAPPMAPVRALFYAPEWGFMISGHSTANAVDAYSLNFWSLEVQPTKITVPQPLSPVRQGYVVRYRVKVTGSHDDPAVGELVDWTLVSGGGNLLDVQSKADAEGYAEARVQYPVTMVDDPDQQKTLLMASVLC